MPFVQILWGEGRSEEQKAQVVKEITETIVRHGGAEADRVMVVISDVPKSNIGTAGHLLSRSPARQSTT